MIHKKYITLILVALLILPAVLSQITRSQVETTIYPMRVYDTGLSEAGVNTYMAHFISDDLLMIASDHGDVDLGGRYVSSKGNIYIYKFEDGKWKKIKTLSAGTYRVGTWTQVTSDFGFFSGNGRYLLEDMFDGAYGTNAKVIDLTDLSTRTIDFSGLPSTNFYPCQIDYTGDYIASGTQSGDIYVWKWDPSQNKYVLIFSYHIGGNIRRLHMTLDARWLIVGGLNNPHLYIFKRTGSTFELVNTIDLEDGVGALGITDPWNVGYIAVGGDSGWVYVFNATKDPANPVLIFKEKLGTGRFYNPFYDRFMPKNVIVLAFKQYSSSSSDSTPAVIVDIMSRKAFKYNEIGRACAVSPSGTWVLLGDAIYMITQMKIYTGASLQMDVTLKMPLLHHDSGRIMEYEAPEGLNVRFYTGDIKITAVATLLRRMQLIQDPVISQAKFGLWYQRGYAKTVPVSYSKYLGIISGESELASIKAVADNAIQVDWKYRLEAPPHFATAWCNAFTVFEVPININISPFDNITLVGSFGVISAVGGWDFARQLIGVTGIPLLIESSSVELAVARSPPVDRFITYVVQTIKTILQESVGLSEAEATTEATIITQSLIQKAGLTGLRSSISTLASYALIAFAIIDVGLGTYYAKNLQIRTFYLVAPVFQDIKTGDKYIASYVLLPSEESLERVREGYEKAFLTSDIKDMLLLKYEWGKTWDDYMRLLKAGRVPPKLNLYTLASYVASYEGIPISRLRLVSLKIGIETRVTGKTALWTFVSGGVYAYSSSVIFGNSLQLWVETKGGQKYTDPEDIANVVGYVIVNGVNYSLNPSADGAVAHFNFPNGADKLVITFPQEGLYLDGEIECKAKLIAPFEKVDPYKYYAKVHYNWKDVLARINKIELINMPEPALFIERIESYKYGTDVKLCYIDTSIAGLEDMFKDTYEYQFWRRLGNMFEYVENINNTWYYATMENTKWIDPFNGATLQPCKTWAFNYFVKMPPDVAVKIYFNGTNVVGTQPRHISFKLISNVEQKEVKLHWKVILKKFDYSIHDWVVNKTWEGDASSSLTAVNQNYTFVILDADEYLGEAYKLIQAGYPVWLVVEANITYASDGNYFKANDYDQKALPILATIPTILGRNGTLTVLVYDIYNNAPIEGATVILRYQNDTLVAYGTTNASGMITFDITLGETYKVEAEKTGYVPLMGNITIAPLGNITVKYLMSPEGLGNLITPVNPIFRGNWTHPPYPIQLSNGTVLWTLAVQVIYNDSAPFEGANITIYEHGTPNIIAQGKTNGTGFVYFWIKNGTVIDVKCEATLDNTTYVFWRNNTLMDRAIWMVFTLPEQSPLYTPEVAVLWGEITIHRGQGYFFGNMSHCIRFLLWTNRPQTVNVTITVINSETNETITTLSKTYDLFMGVNPIYEWFSINASLGMEVQAWINITGYQYDTDPENNALLTRPVWLKPFLDLKVFILWHIVETKTDYAILPEDIIEIDIGIEVPVNLTKVPMTLNITMWGKYTGRVSPIIRKLENITSYAGIIWRNFTIALPWKRHIIVYANASHPWEDMALNNIGNITIDIGPNAKVETIDIPQTAIEGREVSVTYRIVSNLENEPVLLFMQDNTTNTVVYTKQTTLVGNMTVTVKFKAPENPSLLWVLKDPLVKHELQVGFSGYDAYADDNTKPATIIVMSRQALWVAVITCIVFIILILAIIKAVAQTTIEHRHKYWVAEQRRTDKISATILQKTHIEKRKYWRKS